MFYLVIKNLGIEKCIDISVSDIWIRGSHYDCRKNRKYNKERQVRRIFIRCIQNPGTRVLATIWQD